jgi:hypothetical protein
MICVRSLRMNTRFAVYAVSLLCGSSIADESASFPPESNGWKLVSAVPHRPLKESSGLAPSTVRPSIVWSHNDGGAGSFLFAIDAASGNLEQTITLAGTLNLDWEDLFVVSDRKQPLLAVADVGDNEKRRKNCLIHLFEESAGKDGKLSLKKNRTIRFHYPEGKRFDCEAAAFDGRTGNAVVLTKAKSKTLLFEVPLEAVDGEGLVVAKLAGTLTPPAEFPDKTAMVNFKRGIFGTSCTSADISPDGKTLAVLTYTDCFLYRRSAEETWATAVAREPQALALPAIYQAEALCFTPDGMSLIVSSEKAPTPLYRIVVPGPGAD